MKKHIGIFIGAMLLIGCVPDPDMPMHKKTAVPNQDVYQQPQRFKVEQVGIFADELAYDNRRGIYIITDTKTGKEFFGVSGIGISELGYHNAGKSNVGDER